MSGNWAVVWGGVYEDTDIEYCDSEKEALDRADQHLKDGHTAVKVLEVKWVTKTQTYMVKVL